MHKLYMAKTPASLHLHGEELFGEDQIPTAFGITFLSMRVVFMTFSAAGSCHWDQLGSLATHRLQVLRLSLLPFCCLKMTSFVHTSLSFLTAFKDFYQAGKFGKIFQEQHSAE